MEKKDRDKRIKKEIKEFEKFIVDLDEIEQTYTKKLIEELAFMKITLEELKEEVKNSGVVTEMDQGKYSIMRENPALKSYNVTVQRYNQSLKQLDEYINKFSVKESDEIDILGKFIQSR